MTTLANKLQKAPTAKEIISNGSTTDFDCDSLTGWADNDAGFGISTQETFDSRETFKLAGGASFASDNRADREKVLATPGGSHIVMSVIFYPSLLSVSGGTPGLTGNFLFLLGLGDYSVFIAVYSDSIWSLDAGGFNFIANISPEGDWRNITLDITGIGAVPTYDIYYEDTLLASGVTAHTADVALGSTSVTQYSRISAAYTEKLTSVDQILLGDDFA